MTANWANQTIWTGDNLPILRGLNGDSVDLIYLDPPFNSKTNYAAPIGSKAAGAEFKDTWSLSDVDVEWINLISEKHPALYRVLLAATTNSDKSYLAYIAVRLLELHRVLKPTGSIYLHCDPTMSHYLKLVMDAIFKKRNFKNEVVWQYGTSGRGAKAIAKHFPRNHDLLLYYAKNQRSHRHQGVWTEEVHPFDGLPGHIRHDERGYFKTAPRGDYTDASIARLRAEGRIHETRTGTIRPLEATGEGVVEPKLFGSVWDDIPDMMHAPEVERTDYPTQKPLALVERVILASSRVGDMVLDPFCGCATALIAAEQLGRQWVGIDISPKAAELIQSRMRDELGLFYDGAHRTDIPERTDLGDIPPPHTHKQTLYGEQGGYCAGCNTHFEPRNLEVDHIIARNKGGTDHIGNLQLLCGSCNRIKGDRGMEYLRVKLQL